MTKMLLVRHGHVDGINPERFRGRTDVPLTELGVRQAHAVAARIAAAWRPSAIYTSPLGRCVETGRAIAAACGIDSVALESLIDIDYGDWHWMTYDAVNQAWPEAYEAWRSTPHLMRFPNGDSLQDLVARTADAMRWALKQHGAPGDIVVLVGHDSVNRALLLQLLDQPLSAYWRIAQAPCALNEIDIVGGAICVRRINDAQHLGSLK